MIKVPLSWLREYIDIDMSPEELGARLTLRGLEVEGMNVVGAEWDKIVVGEVLEVAKHPNADRLVVVQATDGKQKYQVITGAPNLKVGDKFPLALPGAKLIDGHKLHDEGTIAGSLERRRSDLPTFVVKGGQLRGVESQAVAAAELEVGVSEFFDGIMVLDPAAPTGAPLQSVLGDVIYEFGVTPNMGRTLSMIGIAREISAMTGQPYRVPEITIDENGGPVEDKISVTIEAPDLCPRFDIMVIEGIEIKPSPEWMQRRLRAAGQRTINNIVDVTNYVMLEFGQPLHSFDYDYIRGQKLIVRRAHEGEQIELIDHKERKLGPDVLVVADAERGLSLAGVMGGEDSEIKDTTVNVALEGANWNPANIRETYRGLFTEPSEAAKRFERTVDIELAPLGVRRGIQLIQQLAGGTVAKGLIDEYPVKHETRMVEFPLAEIPRLLGIHVPKDEVIEMLEALEFGVIDRGAVLVVSVPSYRNDITIKADLVEEIARMYGYEKIPETMLRGELPGEAKNPELAFEDKIRTVLTGSGLSEIITYPLIGLDDLKKLETARPDMAIYSERPLLKLANPLSADHEYMRPTTLASLLLTLSENRRFSDRVAIFEVGRVYLPQEGQPLPQERRTLSIGMTGARLPISRYVPVRDPEKLDYFDLKGAVEKLLERLDIPAGAVQYVPLAESDNVALHPGRAAAIIGPNGERLGILGELHPKVGAAFELPSDRVAVAELDLASLMPLVQFERYKTVTRLPITSQDLALIMPEDVPASKVAALIQQTGGKQLASVTLFDLYRGKPIPEGKKSLAYRLSFQPQDRTLTEDEATAIKDKIAKRLARELGAEVRA